MALRGYKVTQGKTWLPRSQCGAQSVPAQPKAVCLSSLHWSVAYQRSGIKTYSLGWHLSVSKSILAESFLDISKSCNLTKGDSLYKPAECEYVYVNWVWTWTLCYIRVISALKRQRQEANESQDQPELPKNSLKLAPLTQPQLQP